MSCPRCDAPVGAEDRTCPACGADVVASPVGGGEGPSLWQEDAAVARTTDGATGALDAGTTAGDVAPGDGSAIVTCSSCGAPNSQVRLLCGRCGADLATGRVADPDEVVRPGEPVDVAGDVDVRDRRDGRRTALVAAVIVIVGALVGVGVGIWAVRSGGPSEPATPTFDEAVYPGEPVDLSVVRVGSSSTRPPAGGEEFGPSNLVDGDTTTVWSHDPSSQAATEADLAFELEQPAWVTEVLVANGAQRGEGSFDAEGRVRSARFDVGADPVAQLRLLDRDGFQRVPLPEPVLADDVLRLVVTDVFPGDTFDELSLSEVTFRGHPAVGDDRDRSG